MKSNTAHPLSSRRSTAGFSRADLVACLLGCALLLGVFRTAWAAVGADVARTACKSNLKLIGQALTSWAKDHKDRLPWHAPYAEGGLYQFQASGNAWIQYSALSNYLDSPNVLKCPADDAAKMALSWSRDEAGGFMHPNYRGNSVSYFVGLDAHPGAPQSFLSGDRNLTPSVTTQSCDAAGVNVAVGFRADDESMGWTKTVHGNPGHILLQSGDVQEMPTSALRQALPNTGAIHPDNHVLLP